MNLWHGLVGVGVLALAVAGLATAGTYTAFGSAQGWTPELVSVAYVAFFLGVAALLAATVARGVSQVGRAVGLARQTD